MGRRKIEIQPITHERNRSVTFLKRKNGLFKKAYELGVLCSVDVAVIIFEDRPGHDIKLHEYSSSDIRNIVQRQLRHQGDSDIKGPGDFSGAAGAKFDEGADVDDDMAEEEEEDMPVRSKRRRAGPKLTMPDADGDSDYNPSPHHRNGHSHPMSHLPPPPMHSSSIRDSSGSGGGGSMLPVSNDRVSSIRDSHTRSSKRPRSTLDSMDPGRRSPVGDMMGGSRAPDLYLPDQQQPGHGRFNRQIRQSHNTGAGAGMAQPHYHNEQHMQQGFAPSYTPMFAGGGQASPPPSFIPLHGHGPSHPHGHGHSPVGGYDDRSSFVRDGGGGGGAGYGGPSSSSSVASRVRFVSGSVPPQQQQQQYDPSLYQGLGGVNVGVGVGVMRHQQHSQHQLPQDQAFPTHSPMHREERMGMFESVDAFLEADRSRAHQGVGLSRVGGGGGGELDWPSHNQHTQHKEDVGGGRVDPVGGAPVSAQIPHDANANGGGSWFDIFSGSNTANANANANASTNANVNANANANNTSAGAPSGSRSPRQATTAATTATGTSWERGGAAASSASASAPTGGVPAPGTTAPVARRTSREASAAAAPSAAGGGSKAPSPVQGLGQDVDMQPPAEAEAVPGVGTEGAGANGSGSAVTNAGEEAHKSGVEGTDDDATSAAAATSTGQTGDITAGDTAGEAAAAAV